MIVLDSGDKTEGAIWSALLQLSDQEPRGWSLIGAQMVALHALEHGTLRPRASVDADVLVDVRVLRDGTRRLARTLMAAGFDLEGAGPDGVGHRFRRDEVLVDVLAPDGVGERANLRTAGQARTVAVPGGTQALHRTERVDVQLGNRQGLIPRPNLLGAILLKARAVEVDDLPESQLLDLAFLLTLVTDPRALLRGIRRSERAWLKRREELLDPDAGAWSRFPNADDARMALRILSAP